MKVQKDSVVTIDYIVTDEENKVLDTTNDQDSLQVLIGHGAIIEGLEEALMGHEAGDRVDVTVAPEKAYGVRDVALVQTVDKSMFGDMELHIGDSFLADTDAGQKPIFIKSVSGDDVVVDGNHPLAGLTLQFHVDVIDVREATESEISHGHVHVDGHCEHDDHDHCCCHHHDDDDEAGDHHCCHHHHDDDEHDHDHKCCHHHDHEHEHEHEHECCCHHDAGEQSAQ